MQLYIFSSSHYEKWGRYIVKHKRMPVAILDPSEAYVDGVSEGTGRFIYSFSIRVMARIYSVSIQFGMWLIIVYRLSIQ